MEANVPFKQGPEDLFRRGEKRFVDRAISFLKHFVTDEIEKYEQGRLFPFPFYVDDTHLAKLDKQIDELLNTLPSHGRVGFTSKTRFRDLSSIRFDSFDQFVSKAGNKEDPESAQLIWNTYAIANDGRLSGGEINIEFMTEQRLTVQDAEPGELYRASVELKVTGSDRDWVDQTYSTLVPWIVTTRLGGIYRPLWFFRNKWFIQALSTILSWIGFFIGINLASKIMNRQAIADTKTTLSRILAESDLVKKIDLFATEVLAPSSAPWWQPIIIIGIGAVTFAIIYLLGLKLLPKLTPNSYLAIGLTKRRAKSYINVFKFVVFDLLLLGIALPIAIELIKRAL